MLYCLVSYQRCFNSHFVLLTHYSGSFFSFQTQFLGQSGLMQLDIFGDRTNVDFHLRKLEGNSEYIQGSWSPSKGLLWSPLNSRHGQNSGNIDKISNIEVEPLIITTVLVSIMLWCNENGT